MSQYGFQQGQGMFNGSGFTVLTVTTSAQAFTAIATHAIRAFCSVETGAGRFRYDGGTPTITQGHIVNSGDSFQILGASNIANFLYIATSAGTSVLMITYEGGVR